MKVSYNWLCEILPGLSKYSAVEVAQKLTFAGLEVEGFEDQKQKLAGIVVGEVLSKDKHPNADKLSLCQVSSGQETYQVVCGAPNVEAGSKFPFATLGTTMPDGLHIKPIQLRKVDSHGMLCSAKELQLSDEANGLLVLDSKLKTGTPIADALSLNDVIFELGITPNRGDALSHWGVVRDLMALFDLEADFSKILPQSQKLVSGDSHKGEADLCVKVADAELCGRFTASRIRGVKVAPSPTWLASRLQSLGLRSINNVVDATNYVMMLTGHPVHAYDARDIKGDCLCIRPLESDLKYKTLDETEQKLKKDDLMIFDQEGPVALAGIMGGANSEIKEDTSEVILEVAFFNPLRVRRTAKRCGLQTDSSYRFERFVNPDSVLHAHQILRDLILSFAGGQASTIIDEYPKAFETTQIDFNPNAVTRLLGVELGHKLIESILTKLGCQCDTQDSNSWTVTVPLFRSDLERSVDLVEEVARIYGLDQIPVQTPRICLQSSRENPLTQYQKQVKQFFMDHGFLETIHYSFTDPEYLKKFDSEFNIEEAVVLQNPIASDLSVFRQSLVPSLFKTYQKNKLKVDHGLQFFELRNVYHKLDGNQTKEQLSLAGLYAGNPLGRNRFEQKRSFDVFDGKGWLESLFETFHIQTEVQVLEEWPYHPGQALVYKTKHGVLAKLGSLHPKLLQDFKIKESVCVFELDFEKFVQCLQESQIQFKAPSVLPPVYRDMALLVPQTLTYQQLQDQILKLNPKYLSDIKLFDVYEGDSLPEGKKSLALSLVYQPQSESLTDEEVNKIHFGLVDQLKSSVGAELR